MENIKQLEEKHFDSVLSLNQFAFQYDHTEQQRLNRIKRMHTETIFGSLDNDQIAAKVHIIPFHTYINGNTYKMGGISGVVTLPEYRRQGMVKHLLKHALKHMRSQGQTISLLYPFSFPFYRKFGWELLSMKKQYTIPMERLKQTWHGEGYMRPSENDIPLLHHIYTKFAKNYNGMLQRDELHWNTSVFKENRRIAIAYNHDDEPEGYIIYHVKKDILTVQEYAYTSMNGWKLILQFIANHDSMADRVKMDVPKNDALTSLLPDPRFEQQVKPLAMARIVNVFDFLKTYSFSETEQPTSTHVHVEDTFLPENSGTYFIKQTGHQTHVTFTKGTEETTTAIHCSVQQLASMMFGFKRPTELFGLEIILGDEQDIHKLEQLIPHSQPFLMDFF